MKSQPAYPFYTRFGTHAEGTQFTAWISDDVVVEVECPRSYSPRATITVNRNRYRGQQPRFISVGKPDHLDVLVTRAEFMAAYHAAHEFMQAAASELLPVTPVQLITSAQAKEITCLLDHPAFSRPAKTRWLLRLNKLTHAEAQAAIQVITDTRKMFDGPDFTGQFAVKGEVFHVKAA